MRCGLGVVAPGPLSGLGWTRGTLPGRIAKASIMSVPLNPDRQGESRRGRERVWVNEKQLRSHNTGNKTPVTGHSLTVRSPNLNHVGLGSGSVGMYRVRPVKRHRGEPGHRVRDTRLYTDHTDRPHNMSQASLTTNPTPKRAHAQDHASSPDSGADRAAGRASG